MSGVSWALALLLAAISCMPVHAQILTEQQFLDDALPSHPGIAVAEANIAAASGVRRQVGIVNNPVITWERENPDLAPRQDTWRLGWRLPFDGRRHRMAAADAEVAASRTELDATRLATRLELRSLFASWYLAVEREALLLAHLEKTSRLAGWLQARADEGEAAGVEARRLELEVEVVEREVSASRAEALAWRAAAGIWSSMVTDDIRPTRPPLPTPPAAAGIGDRSDILTLVHRVAAAESRLSLERRVLEPPVISAGWIEIRDGRQSFDGPVFGVIWPLPLFDRNQGKRQVAAAEADGARSEVEVSRRLALQQAEAALASYSELFEAVVRGGSSAVTAGVVEAVFAAFAAGEASLTDVLDALRATVDVQMARVDSMARALAAERDLEAALGRPIFPGGSS
jgi:cobalt-zinc-cadmium efflux system outer membrane protein